METGHPGNCCVSDVSIFGENGMEVARRDHGMAISESKDIGEVVDRSSTITVVAYLSGSRS